MIGRSRRHSTDSIRDWALLARPPRSQQRSPGLPSGWASGARRGAGLEIQAAGASGTVSVRKARARAHAARARPNPTQTRRLRRTAPRRSSPQAHLTAPLRLRRSRTNRQKDSACCAPRDPEDAPSIHWGLSAVGARNSGWAVPRPGPSGLTVATSAAATVPPFRIQQTPQGSESPHRRLKKMADDIDIEAMLEAPYKKVRENMSGEMCDRGGIKLLQSQPSNGNGRRSQEWHRSQEIDSGWLLAWPHGA
ncbi:hypothetical protein J0S82_020536 [Galemys pyrenaicus]|uniref:Uncharacterized protein n=1 Tax=Galemys pyrenaicus TaxID=202257 RepID=A0A8J6AGH0_GALPY|nr:hypothetical protein J0S82_020536 [Galemys pyrenaicus]